MDINVSNIIENGAIALISATASYIFGSLVKLRRDMNMAFKKIRSLENERNEKNGNPGNDGNH
jgi:K+-transporting ATPase A subunit